MATKVVFMYDFDNTLINGSSEETLVKEVLGYKDDNDWWGKVNNFGEKNNMDPVLVMLYFFKAELEQKNIPATRNLFKKCGENFKYFAGLESWFDRINNYAKNLNLEVEHYIISSGLKEIIQGTSIAKNFKKIFASEYLYGENGEAKWPAQSINYTNKTQYIFRIRKGLINNLADLGDVNFPIEDKSKLLPFEHMVYFGDGITDVPCMKILSSNNGSSICVYNPNEEKSCEAADNLFKEKRANFIAPADYSKGSKLENISKQILNDIAKIKK